MTYSVATVQDMPDITNYINALDYFMPVDPSQLGGNWVLARDARGAIAGTIWFFHQAPHAYIDYWAGSSSLVAAKLGSMAEMILRAMGVRYVRGTIAVDNPSALRLAVEGMGMIPSSSTYILTTRQI